MKAEISENNNISFISSIESQLNRLLTNPYNLSIGRSTIESAGLGVFSNGYISKGSIISFYPGTIYSSYDNLFLQSIRNSYIMRLSDGSFVDAKPKGLSRSIFKSLRGKHGLSEWGWYEHKNSSAFGHLINHSEASPNVSYYEIEFDSKFLDSVPYITYDSIPKMISLPVIVSIRDIYNEELFSTYLSKIEQR